ncbi:MAG: hypothetical protein Fur0037_17580 [Planctomycetota bacterium]
MNPLSLVSVGAGLVLLPFLSQPNSTKGEPRYVGSKVCKNCHTGADKGNAYGIWEKTKHAQAFANLGSDQAKKIAKEKGIEDPQKDGKCLKCHVAAYGVDEKLIKRGFKMEDGVQCEACHGPGEEHFKNRMKDAAKPGSLRIQDGEIRNLGRTMELCGKCHNPESPVYQPFCLKERMQKIEHLDPRKKRTEEEIKKLRETDAKDCEVCKAKK